MLTRDFASKILELAARWRLRLPFIILGESGVGKTRALRIFTRLLEASKEIRPQMLQELFDEMRQSFLVAKEQGVGRRGVEEAMDELLEEGFTHEGFKDRASQMERYIDKRKGWRSSKLLKGLESTC